MERFSQALLVEFDNPEEAIASGAIKPDAFEGALDGDSWLLPVEDVNLSKLPQSARKVWGYAIRGGEWDPDAEDSPFRGYSDFCGFPARGEVYVKDPPDQEGGDQ